MSQAPFHYHGEAETIQFRNYAATVTTAADWNPRMGTSTVSRDPCFPMRVTNPRDGRFGHLTIAKEIHSTGLDVTSNNWTRPDRSNGVASLHFTFCLHHGVQSPHPHRPQPDLVDHTAAQLPQRQGQCLHHPPSPGRVWIRRKLRSRSVPLQPGPGIVLHESGRDGVVGAQDGLGPGERDLEDGSVR